MAPSSGPRQRKQPAQLADQDVLDEEEQEQEIAALERAAAVQRRQHKRLLAAAAAVLIAAYLALALHQALHPWQLRLHAELRAADIPPASLVVGLLGGAVAVGAGAAAALSFGGTDEVSWRKLLNLTVTLAALEAAFWGTALVKMSLHPGFQLSALLRVAWLPLAPALWTAAVVTVINGLDKMRAEFHALRGARYPLKRA